MARPPSLGPDITEHLAREPAQDPARASAKNSGGLRAALAASGVVGIWRHDIWADRLSLSAPLARLLGLRPDEGRRGRPLAALLAATHGDDRVRVESALHAALSQGGAVAVAFRTAPAARWLDLRGRIERDAAGRPIWARGIVLDLTEDRTEIACDQHRVNRMAEHAIALRGLSESLDRPGLTRFLDRLMVEIGFELARHLRGAPDKHRH